MPLHIKPHPSAGTLRIANTNAIREKVETFLRRLSPDDTISSAEIAKRLKASPNKVSEVLQALRKSGTAVNRGNGTSSKWAYIHRGPKGSQGNGTSNGNSDTSTPRYICPGSQPNGSQAYWAVYQARLMTPARQPAGQ